MGLGYHAVDSLARQYQKFIRNSRSSVLLKNNGEISADSICRPPVPSVEIWGLVACQDIHEALLLGPTKNSWRI